MERQEQIDSLGIEREFYLSRKNLIHLEPLTANGTVPNQALEGAKVRYEELLQKTAERQVDADIGQREKTLQEYRERQIRGEVITYQGEVAGYTRGIADIEEELRTMRTRRRQLIQFKRRELDFLHDNLLN